MSLHIRKLGGVWYCQECKAKWPCLAIQKEWIDLAVEKRKIEEDNKREHTRIESGRSPAETSRRHSTI